MGKWDGEGRQRRRCPAESERGAQVEGHPQGAAAAPKGFVVRQTLAGDEQEEVTVVPRLPSAVGRREAGAARIVAPREARGGVAAPSGWAPALQATVPDTRPPTDRHGYPPPERRPCQALVGIVFHVAPVNVSSLVRPDTLLYPTHPLWT